MKIVPAEPEINIPRSTTSIWPARWAKRQPPGRVCPENFHTPDDLALWPPELDGGLYNGFATADPLLEMREPAAAYAPPARFRGLAGQSPKRAADVWRRIARRLRAAWPQTRQMTDAPRGISTLLIYWA